MIARERSRCELNWQITEQQFSSKQNQNRRKKKTCEIRTEMQVGFLGKIKRQEIRGRYIDISDGFSEINILVRTRQVLDRVSRCRR